MKKNLALCLALLSTYSFAYVGSVPLGQPQKMNSNQVDNLKSSMSPKVRVYNDSSEPVIVQAYSIDSSWDYASSWQPSKGYSINMRDHHPELVPAHSWIDLYSADSSTFATPTIKYQVYGRKVKADGPISFTFSNISTMSPAGIQQPKDFYYGWDYDYKKHVHLPTGDNGCIALVINDTAAVVATYLDRDTCDVTQAKLDVNMFTLY